MSAKQAEFLRLDRGSYSKQAPSLAKETQRVQKHESISKFEFGKSKEGKPNQPAKWLLYSPKMPPKITKESWHDPSGETGFPGFVVLDDQCQAIIQELGLSQRQKAYTWPANFLTTGYHPISMRHLGRPALDNKGRYLWIQEPGKKAYVYHGDLSKYPGPKNFDDSNSRELSIVTTKDTATGIVTPQKANPSRLGMELLAPSDIEEEEEEESQEVLMARLAKENEVLRKIIGNCEELVVVVEKAQPKFDAMIRKATPSEKSKFRKTTDAIQAKLEVARKGLDNLARHEQAVSDKGGSDHNGAVERQESEKVSSG